MRFPEGYFLLEQGGTNQAPLADSKLLAPLVVGQTIRVPWAKVQPSAGKFDWSEVDSRLAQCKRLNRKAKLLIQTGRDGMSPDWIGGQWIVADGKRIPAPWSPQLRDAISDLTKEAGKCYNANPLIVGVHATGPTWPSAEMHPAPNLSGKKGYSHKAMETAWLNAIGLWAAAFPDVAVLLSISVKEVAAKYCYAVVSAAFRQHGSQFTVQHNALAAKTSPTADHHEFVRDCHRAGMRVWFEMLCTVKDFNRFGSRNVMDGINKGKLIGASGFDVYPQPEDIKGLR